MEDDFEMVTSGTPSSTASTVITPASPTALTQTIYVADNVSYSKQSSQDNKSHGEPNFVDGSGPLFSMYLELAEEEDKKMAESWKADADATLVFVSPISCLLCQ